MKSMIKDRQENESQESWEDPVWGTFGLWREAGVPFAFAMPLSLTPLCLGSYHF